MRAVLVPNRGGHGGGASGLAMAAPTQRSDAMLRRTGVLTCRSELGPEMRCAGIRSALHLGGVTAVARDVEHGFPRGPCEHAPPPLPERDTPAAAPPYASAVCRRMCTCSSCSCCSRAEACTCLSSDVAVASCHPVRRNLASTAPRTVSGEPPSAMSQASPAHAPAIGGHRVRSAGAPAGGGPPRPRGSTPPSAPSAGGAARSGGGAAHCWPRPRSGTSPAAPRRGFAPAAERLRPPRPPPSR